MILLHNTFHQKKKEEEWNSLALMMHLVYFSIILSLLVSPTFSPSHNKSTTNRREAAQRRKFEYSKFTSIPTF
jgi:hypothetical protein